MTVVVANLGLMNLLCRRGRARSVEVLPSLRCGDRSRRRKGRVRHSAASAPMRAPSRPRARFASTSDGRLLFSRRGIDPFKGKWDFPGGFLDEEEHPLDCIRRELEEEAGVEVEPLEFLGVWLDRYGGDGSATDDPELLLDGAHRRGRPGAGGRRRGAPLVRARRDPRRGARVPAFPRLALSLAGAAPVTRPVRSRS